MGRTDSGKLFQAGYTMTQSAQCMVCGFQASVMGDAEWFHLTCHAHEQNTSHPVVITA